uniref:Uncharacterized protein n=1 Tax=Megaviridae environmental sample TaxID=1737588 RepID=A0A5J6VKE7_9VIRU|nr:MAG: hypothetical protein [Megaviridae environmental sample]
MYYLNKFFSILNKLKKNIYDTLKELTYFTHWH